MVPAAKSTICNNIASRRVSRDTRADTRFIVRCSAPMKEMPRCHAFHVLAFALAVGASCSGGGANRPIDHGALAALETGTQRVTPQGEPAAALESKPAAARTLPPLEDPLRLRLVQGFQRAGAAEGITVVADERLDRAMSDLARALDDDEDPRSEAVEFLLGYHGIIEPYPHMLLLGAHPTVYDQLVARVLASPKLPRAAVVTVGVGIDTARTVHKIVVALQEKYLDLAPVARKQAPGAVFELAGSLLGSFSSPTVYVTVPNGIPSERPLLTDGMAFRAPVACDRGDGHYQLEVFGSDASGPRVLANFTVFCGVEAPDSLPGRGGYVPTPIAGDEAERQLFALINEARATAALPAVAADPDLARVARAHSRDMLNNEYIAHISPTTGSPADRVAKAGIAVTRLAENVGTSSSPEELHKGLMRSPGHRAAILDPKVTRVGVGVAVPEPGQRYRVVGTELFR
jgi:uncharacterized protein YkwD